ncbi:plant intracellular Ras-group-related LRR protein 3 [Andrographis paniculata]|uniref:plant intracellular Ras-group-related LRR protein 3 n=1 Tax=Andrographis paniculata TaxID=175694 RepID=UPI0021E7A56F|nr:plant intracellular Ras-group-related LRR protein 3 [Andrographis paniculata]
MEEQEIGKEMITGASAGGYDYGDDVVLDEEVVRILTEAQNSNKERVIERIDLSGRRLKFLPEALGKIQGLIFLNLSKNHLQVLPDSISGLRKLEELDVSSNLLEGLPDSIGLLVNLKVLNVSGNKLQKLPESIAGCRSLIELDASFNNLMFLPTNIGYGLTNLQKLSIYLNKIRALPNSICEMKSLEYLNAHFNAIHALPSAIGRLTNLQVLNVSRNFSDLTELPESISDLTNLQELDISNNQIRALPDTFYRLQNLRKLDCHQNPLVVPPIEIAVGGVEDVREYMVKIRMSSLQDEQRMQQQRQRLIEENENGGWATWGASLLQNVYSGVSQTVSGYFGSNSPKDPFLDQQL